LRNTASHRTARPTGITCIAWANRDGLILTLSLSRLTDMAIAAGCYKSILNCSEKNIGFYEKCGYKFKEVSMAKYLDR
jgi:hypothetical protein